MYLFPKELPDTPGVRAAWDQAAAAREAVLELETQLAVARLHHATSLGNLTKVAASAARAELATAAFFR